MLLRRHGAWMLPAGAGLLAVLAYWTGLHGPFLLDDAPNLRAIPEWLAGKIGLWTLVFDRGAGLFGRPVSMASFAFNAWLGGYAPFPLKLGNLIVHLLCGGALFGFLRALLRHDPLLQARAPLYAGIVAALWLLHPLHASTVLYVVQRMAQLSTLFVLLGLWLYVALRTRLERGPSTAASAGLLLGIPAMTVIAFLSKENGALLPLLCGVVELAYFGGKRRPGSVRLFYALALLLPAMAAAARFAMAPGRYVGGYVGRDFSMAERLLSQPRALCDYLGKLLLPNPPRMGIYTDDFAISTGLLSPPTTLLAILALLALTLAAWHWRKALPALWFGWLFFLAAHALEASPIPLELYFEHRNYLPSVGLLTAAVALAVAAGRALARGGLRPGRIGAVLTVCVLGVLAFGTHGRARVWQSETLIAESALIAHPHSLRAAASAMGAAIDRGDKARAHAILDDLEQAERPRNRALAHAYRVYVDCIFDQRADPADLDYFVTQSPMPLTRFEAQPFHYLHLVTAKRPCAGIDDKLVGTSLAQLADRDTVQSERRKVRLRYTAASYLMRARDWPATLEQARLAWQPNADPPIAQPLFLAQLHLRDLAGAERTLQELEARSDPTNTTEQAFVRWHRVQLEEARKHLQPAAE